jgi:biotin transport system substrate-specific component
MSLQSYAVVVLATLLGFRLAAPALLLYLLAGALGAPVFAGGAAGVEHLTGSTGGYLAGFLLATAVCGNAVAARHAAAHPLGGTPWMLFAHALILALGAGWLAQTIGWERAVAGGLSPFLLGALVKSLAAALTVWALWRCVRRWLPS